jgi:hypothetical protein
MKITEPETTRLTTKASKSINSRVSESARALRVLEITVQCIASSQQEKNESIAKDHVEVKSTMVDAMNARTERVPNRRSSKIGHPVQGTHHSWRNQGSNNKRNKMGKLTDRQRHRKQHCR